MAGACKASTKVQHICIRHIGFMTCRFISLLLLSFLGVSFALSCKQPATAPAVAASDPHLRSPAAVAG
jgi:hypothetical protein